MHPLYTPENTSAAFQLNWSVVCAAKHSWRLARIGILSNHFHILLNVDVTESPENIALSLMNNLAYVQQMKAVLRYSYYVGTFGRYDRGAVRNNL